MINRRQICNGTIITMWILLVIASILLIKACRIKYEIIPQTIQIESFTHDGRTHEYVKEFSYYDKKRNIHTITSNLFIDSNLNDCSCAIDYNYAKDGRTLFRESCNQLTRLSTKQRYRIESEHLWYTSSMWGVSLMIIVIITQLIITIVGTIRISNRMEYTTNYYNSCHGCEEYCGKKACCMWGKFVDNEGLHENINKFFGFQKENLP